MQLKLNSPIYVGLLLFCLITITGVSSAEKLDVSFVSQYNDLYSDNSISNALVTQEQDFSSHYGGSVYNVAVAGNYAYVGQGQDMLVIDITDSSNPSRVGRVTTPALVNSVAVSGNYAYVANGENGLVIVDIANKTMPTIKGNYSTDSANGVAVSGNYAYVADGYNGLQVVDVSNPDAPSIEETCNTAGYSSSVILSGNYAYVADGADGLVVIDITNPANPTIEATCDTSGRALDIAISGNYTYIADNSTGLVVINITEPASPTITGSVNISTTAIGVALSGNYAYIVDGSASHLVVVDITNKTSPTSVEVYDDTEGYAYDVAVSGNYAYTAFGRSGLAIVNITNPTSTSTAGQYDASGFASGVAVSGNYAYLAYGYMGLTIVDVSNKESPTLAGSYITTGYARDVAVAGDYAYIADDTYGLVIVDVADKESPTPIGHYDTSGRSWGVTVIDNYAYIADGANGFVIVNVANPNSPTLVGNCDTPGNAETVAIAGDYAYVADYESGLTIIDISHPATPTVVYTYDTTGLAYGISVVNNCAYIADGTNGLVILNVTNPASPTSMGSYDTYGAQNIVVSGNYAYIADDGNGLVIIDISNPESPVFEDSYNTAGLGYGVAISGSYVYVADFGNGLVILHVDTVPDTTAPASVIGLNEVSVGSSWINWAWTNPTDEDFNHTTVYIDGIFVENTSTGYYNLTGLDEGTAHTISTKTVDTSGNINSTWANDSASTTSPTDIIPPASITNLGEADVDSDWIRWTWTNPADVDFSHVMVYLNGTFIANTTDSSISYYNATGLSEGATYTIGIQTVDSSGNINSTTVSDSAITRNYPVVSGVSGTNITKTSITLTWAASDDTTTVQISRNDVVIGNVTGTTSYVDGSLTSGTTYRYTLVPYNQDGLEGEAVSVSLRTSSSSSGGSSGGSSSSGGSGGAASVEDFANVATKDVAKAYLRINTTATYQFTKEGNPIQSISLYSLKNSGEIVSTVEVLNNRSKLVNSTPEGNIYQYVNMWVGKAGFATASSIKDSHVKFKVNASWIQQMGVSPSDVKLQRYNGNVWQVLPTTIVSNTTDYVVFESQTPGFSPFAITAEKVALTASNGDVQSSNETKIPVSNVTQTEDDHKEGTQSTASIWTIIAAILVIGFTVVGYTYLKKGK